MTRIAGIPEQLRAAASLLAASAPELELAARALASAPLPAMPPGVAGAVQTTLTSAAATLRTAAATSDREGHDLQRRGLWLEVADNALAAWGTANVFRPVVQSPLDVLDLVARRRALGMLRIWGQYERTVVPIVDEYGHTEPTAVIKLLFQGRRDLSADRYKTIVDKAGDLDAYERASDVPLPLLRDIAGKTLGPLGIAGGIQELGWPAHHGWKGVGDRVAGGATVLGSTLGTGISIYGLETTAMFLPGVDVIAGGLLLAAAGWEIYENRKVIMRDAVAGGRFLINHPIVLAGPAGVAAQVVWDNRKPLAHAAVSGAEWGEHRADDAAQTALSAGKSAVHEVTGLFG